MMKSLRTAGIASAAALILAAGAGHDSAQLAGDPAPPQAGPPAWSFNVTPYLWMAWLKVDLGYNLPRGLGGKLPTTLEVGPGEIYNNLRFGGTFAADARYGRFSALTDFIYLNEGFDFNHTRLRSADFTGAAPQPIPRGSVVDTSSVSKTTIW